LKHWTLLSLLWNTNLWNLQIGLTVFAIVQCNIWHNLQLVAGGQEFGRSGSVHEDLLNLHRYMHTVSVQLFLSCRVSCVKNTTMSHIASSSDVIYTTEDMLQIIVATHLHWSDIFMGLKMVILFSFITTFLANNILQFKIVLYVIAKAISCQYIHSNDPVIHCCHCPNVYLLFYVSYFFGGYSSLEVYFILCYSTLQYETNVYNVILNYYSMTSRLLLKKTAWGFSHLPTWWRHESRTDWSNIIYHMLNVR
jgi:hypothetical protein